MWIEREGVQEAEVGIAKVWAGVLKEAKFVVGESNIGELWCDFVSICGFG